VLLLTLILVEWQELATKTLFIIIIFALHPNLSFKIWSEAGPLSHWPAPPPMTQHPGIC